MKYTQKFFKLVFTFIFASVLFSACNMAKFDTLPGSRLENTPSNLIGAWGGKMSSSKGSIDTFTVEINPNSIMVRTSYNFHELQLGKDYVINKLDKYIVIGLNDPNFKVLKNIVLLEESKNGWFVYPFTEANMPFDNRDDMEDLFESRYFYSSNETIELPSPVSASDFDTQTNDKVRNHYYKMDESRIEALLNSRFRGKNYMLISRPKINIPSTAKPKSTKK